MEKTLLSFCYFLIFPNKTVRIDIAQRAQLFSGFLFVRAQKGICRDGNRVGTCLFVSGDGNGKQSAGRTA